MTSLATGGLQGPNISHIEGFIASLMEERNEKNFIIWDLVHGVAISQIVILRNMHQRVKSDFMRDDFEGFSPLHVLALQGRVRIVLEAISLRNKIKEIFAMFRGERREESSSFFVGNRTLLHLLALGGHNKCLGLERDEYDGTAKDIAKIVSGKCGNPFADRRIIPHTHMDALDLLKIWTCFRPGLDFQRNRARNVLQLGQFRPIQRDVLGVARLSESLGFGAYATEDLPRGHIIGTYKGVFNPFALDCFLEENPTYLIQKSGSIFLKPDRSTEYFADIVDGKTYCSKEAFINDAVPPSLVFIGEVGVGGLPFRTRCVTLRDIRKGEFLGACYASHQMRMRADYIEMPEAISERNAFIRGLERKRDLSELSIYERNGVNAVVATPQLVFRWLKSGEVSFSQIENIFRLYLQLGLNNEVDLYAAAFLLMAKKLKDPKFATYFFQNWIDPILTNEDLVVSNNQDFMYKGLATACMELVNAELAFAETFRIQLNITRLDESRHQCEIKILSV